MNTYLIEFDHDSKYLGYAGKGQLLINANSFENATHRVSDFYVDKENTANGYKWQERFTNARNFVNLTVN